MSKNFKSLFRFTISLAIIIIFLASINNPAQAFHQNNQRSRLEEVTTSTQLLNISNLFLPSTNVTIDSFISGVIEDSFTASVLSINTTHWYIQFDYFFNSSPSFPSPFYSYVDRGSRPDTIFSATNYYNWFGDSSNDFDFWINTSKLSNTAFTITDVNLSLNGVGLFDAWKVSGDMEGVPFTGWYEKNSGLFLSLNIYSTVWYNLTSLDLPQIPENYAGPSLAKVFPVNGSTKPGGTNVEIEFGSLHGIEYFFYQWDNGIILNNTDTNQLLTYFPDTEGSHILNIEVTEKIGYNNTFDLVFITNNSLLSINLLDLTNNSKINGNEKISLKIFSGNGTFIYNWDANTNSTVPENTLIPVNNPLIERIAVLSVFVKGNNTLEWVTSKFIFIIDNTPPILVITNFNNETTLKGTVKIDVTANEISKLLYNLNGGTNTTFSLKANQTQSVSFSNLLNGSYIMNINIKDEANNTRYLVLIFSIYTSSFNWVWNLHKNTPEQIPFLDTTGDLLFILTITSDIDQNFTVIRNFDNSSLNIPTDLIFLFKFIPDSLENIIYVEFFLPLGSSSTTVLDIYEWQYWDDQQEKWIPIDTNYNNIENGWEATLVGGKSTLALIKTGEITTLTYANPGGGIFAPSFSIESLLFAFIAIVILKNVNLKTNKKLR